ncbi:sugar 3,4-ketoisomerase [Tellurirhabdus rosea]|uniref:sugar 3,4-ketoisomerase n=1 Tax=Tellurirhabdus rosea TaxID=2674997 RepID=UPI00224DF59C|nr:FdtA/QdtA family cupin domain-containing protein [Tellurirhabdus rosea]
MAQLLELNTFSSESGNLTVFEKIIPGTIKRVFYVHENAGEIGIGYRHHKAWSAFMCLNGSCRIYVNTGAGEELYVLDEPQKCLILEPGDWRRIDRIGEGAVLLQLSNEVYDPADYIYEKYQHA